MKIMGDRVLVKPIEKQEEVTESGIFIPDTIKEKPNEATVIEVGEGKLLQDGTYLPALIKKGDTVRFIQNAGLPFKLDGEEYLLMETHHILAVL